LLFCYVLDDFFTPELANRIRRLNIPMVNYQVDMPHQWYRVLRSAPYFDLICCSHLEYMERLSCVAPTLFVPMAASPVPPRSCDVDPVADVVFVGSYSPERARVLHAVAEAVERVVVYGGGWQTVGTANSRRNWAGRIAKAWNDTKYYLWPRLQAEGVSGLTRTKYTAWRDGRRSRVPQPFSTKGLLTDDEFAVTIAGAKIALGIGQRYGQIGTKTQYGVGHVRNVLRDFEVPACGVFYLAQRYPEQPAYFVEGREIEAWSTVPELITKLKHYLENSDDRRRVAAAGRHRVLSSHTWEHRYAQIVTRLALPCLPCKSEPYALQTTTPLDSR